MSKHNGACWTALALALTGCVPAPTARDAAHAVILPGEIVTLEEHCAREHEHMRTAHALLADGQGSAHALVSVEAGPIVGGGPEHPPEPGVTLWVDRLHAVGPPGARVQVALALGAVRGRYAPALGRTGPDGEIRYEGYADARRTGAVGRAIALVRPVPGQVRLLVRFGGGEPAAVLEGPVLTDLETAFALAPVELRELSLAQTLNPLQKGGLWSWLASGARYDRCRRARTAALRRFDELVQAGALGVHGFTR